MGRFTYALSALPPEARQTLLMLARFAEFSGAGRMTGQGLGQVRIITMDENQRRKYLQMSKQHDFGSTIDEQTLIGIYQRYKVIQNERNRTNHARETADRDEFDSAYDLLQFMQAGIRELQSLQPAAAEN